MKYKFEIQPLPYAYDALEPYIDAKTVQIHHDRHVQTYVDNLNNALEKHPEFQSWSLEKLLYNLDKLPEAIKAPVRNSGGGVYNHNLYFDTMTANAKPLSEGALLTAISKEFGSVEAFKAELKAAALTVFGSGWAWLVASKDGSVKIIKTPNQDNQIGENLCAVLNLDVWEHSYYLKYENKRAEYIENWFNVINWTKAEENYSKFANTDFSQE
jgi:superoxide dismutase, Fe-Mn family